MADKKNKKPQHTNLVVPGDEKKDKKPFSLFGFGKKEEKQEKQGHDVQVVPTPAAAKDASAEEEKAPAAERQDEAKAAGPGAPPAPKAAKPTLAKTGQPGQDPWREEELPPGAVRMPAQKPKKKKLSAAKRRRRFKRIRAAVVLALVGAGVLFYTSGAYLSVATLITDTFDNLRIAARPGGGYPADFGLTNYVNAEAMGTSGFIALGESEALMFSSSGAELRTIQHNYLNARVTAGKTRVCLYGQGGKEYTVESRTKNLAKISTEQELLFCEMSPDGRLAVATSSRFRATLQVLGPDYDNQNPLFSWPLVDENPSLVAFHSDNKSFVLGCLSTRGGALGSTLYLLRTDRSAVQNEIRVDDAVLLQASYAENHRITAVFNTFTAVYNSRGEELARYDYSGRRLLTSSIQDGMVALAFGTTAQESVQTVLLDKTLNPQFDKAAKIAGVPKVLAARTGAWLLVGQDLFAYKADGALVGSDTLEAKALGLVYGGQPLLLTSGKVLPLDSYFDRDEASATDLSSSASRAEGQQSQPQSTPAHSTPAQSDVSLEGEDGLGLSSAPAGVEGDESQSGEEPPAAGGDENGGQVDETA